MECGSNRELIWDRTWRDFSSTSRNGINACATMRDLVNTR
jgi:hypothetical protein